MAKVGKSEAQQEYNKLKRKLIREIEKGTQRGFIFPEDVLPPTPKRITRKHVEELQAIKPSHLYKNSEWVDAETGEVFSYEQIADTLHSAIGNVKQAQAKARKGYTLKSPTFNQTEELSEEERKEINRERGKKAWETRRARMSDEEYQEFRRLFSERMAKGKANKSGEPYYPKLTAVEAVHDKLQDLTRDTSTESLGTTLHNLKREVPPYFEPAFNDMKSTLVSMYDDIVSYHESTNTITDYEEYLNRNMETINEHLTVIRYSSDWETVSANFVGLMTLLNQGALSMGQAENLEEAIQGSMDYEEY